MQHLHSRWLGAVAGLSLFVVSGFSPREPGAAHASAPAPALTREPSPPELRVEVTVGCPEASALGLHLVARATGDAPLRFEVVYAGGTGFLSSRPDIRLDLDGVRQVGAKVEQLAKVGPGLSATIRGADGAALALHHLPAEPATDETPERPARFELRRPRDGAMFSTDNSFSLAPESWAALVNALPDTIRRACTLARDSAARTLEAR